MSDFKLVQVEAKHTHWPYWSLTILREDERWHVFHSRTSHLPTCGKWTRSFRSPIKKRPGGISTISSLCLRWENAQKEIPWTARVILNPAPPAYVFWRVINLRHHSYFYPFCWTCWTCWVLDPASAPRWKATRNSKDFHEHHLHGSRIHIHRTPSKHGFT